MKVILKAIFAGFLGLQFSASPSFSQCATYLDNKIFEDLRYHKEHHVNSRLEDVTMYVPIKIHIITRDDGTGGVSMNEIMQGIMYTNKHFAAAGIQFFITGAPNIIKSTEFFTISATTEAKYAPIHQVANACNIFYGNEVLAGAQSVGGYAYYPYGPLRIMMNNSVAAEPKTLPHEMGHFWGLPHTFEGSNSSDPRKRELVKRGTGGNCATAGDLLCDTPADPFADGTSTSFFANCIYTETRTDLNGDKFAPMLTNIMSYYFGCEKPAFTQEQINVIKSYKTDTSRTKLNLVPPSVTAPSNLTKSISSLGITLNWTDNSANEAGFIIEASEGSEPYKAIGYVPANTTAFTYRYGSAFTSYSFRVKPANSVSSFSNVVLINTLKLYCVSLPVYPCSTKTGTGFYSIARVTLKGETILDNATSVCDPVGYAYFADQTSSLVKGETYGITVQQATLPNGMVYPVNIGVWIDFNENGLLTDPNEFVKIKYPASQAAIFVPANTTSGTKRMRIRILPQLSTLDSSSSCVDYNSGETEDYEITIQNLPAVLPVNLTVSQLSRYETKVNWTFSGIPPNTKCLIERSKTLNGVYDEIDTVTLSKLAYVHRISENGGFYYRLRSANNRGILSNKTGIIVSNYSVPFSLKGSQNGNVILLTMTGDSTYFKKVLLRRSIYAFFDYFQPVDSVKTYKKFFEDFKIPFDTDTIKYQLLDSRGLIVSNVIAIPVTKNYCKPAYTSSTPYLSNFDVYLKKKINSVTSLSQIISPVVNSNYQDESFNKFEVENNAALSVLVYNDGNCVSGMPKSVQNNVAMWVDFNEDMVFSPGEKIFSQSYPALNCSFDVPVSLPASLDGGAKRIRVITTPINIPISDPCGTYADGRGGDGYFLVDKPSVQTGLREAAETASGIQVFPNPSENGTFHIQSNIPVGRIEIFNDLGSLTCETFLAKVEDLSSGLYIIRIFSTDGILLLSTKVIVK